MPRPWLRHRSRLLTAGVIAGSLAGSMPTANAAADCAAGEYFDMTDSVVTVIEGPGDVDKARVRWEQFAYSYLDGAEGLFLNDQLFHLKKQQ